MIIIGIIGTDSRIANDIIQDLESEFWFIPLSLKDNSLEEVLDTLQTSNDMNYNERYIVHDVTSSEEVEKLRVFEDVMMIYAGKFINNNKSFMTDMSDIHIVKNYNVNDITDIISKKFWFELALNPPM